MPARTPIPARNQSPSGWWIYNEVQQWVSLRQKKLTPNSRCLVYENTRIIRAKNREAAYQKAMKLGAEGYPMSTEGGEWRFVGISLLLPVHEPLEDGAELIWRTRENMTQKAIKKLIREKHQLSVFDDAKDSTE